MGTLLTLLGNLLIGTFNTLSLTLSDAIHKLTQFNDSAIDTAKNIGMPFQQSIAYTKVLTTETQRLAVAYGVTNKEIVGLQNMLSQATGRAALLNHEQMEGLLQTQKFIDAGTQNSILSTLDAMGASVGTANDEMHKFVSNASKAGVAVGNASNEFANNLKLANQYTFASGVEGISKMTILSQKLHFNLSSVLKATENLSEFSKAIEVSAKLQTLGGLGAAYGANPLTLMYEGMEDPESLVERFTKMFESMAVFDTKTGTGKISGQNMQIIKAQAEALGISAKEAVNMAKNGARANAIQGQMGNVYDQLTEDQQAFMTNKSQWNDKTQKFEINVLNEKTGQMETRPIDSLTPSMIAQYQKEASMTTTDAVNKAATELVTFHERAEAYESAKAAMMAETMYPMLGELFNLQKNMMDLGVKIMQYFASNIANPHWWANIGIGLLELLADAIALPIGGLAALIGYGIDGIIAAINGIIRFFGGSGFNYSYENHFKQAWDASVGNIHEAFKDFYYDDVVSTDAIIEDVKKIGTTIGNAATAVVNGLQKDTITDKLQESLDKIGKPGATESVSNNAISSYSNAVNNYNTQSYNSSNSQNYSNSSSAQSYYSPYTPAPVQQSYNTSEVYQAVTNSDGSVSYLSSNGTTNTFNNARTYGDDIVKAIDNQTDVIVSLGTSPVLEKGVYPAETVSNVANVTNSDTNQITYSTKSVKGINTVSDVTDTVIYPNDADQRIKSPEPVGSIVKGGEVTNGVTIQAPRETTSVTSKGTIAFEPLRLDISGTINLAGGGGSTSINAQDLLKDDRFTNALADTIKARLQFLDLNKNRLDFALNGRSSSYNAQGTFG